MALFAAQPALADQWDALREDERVHNGLLVVTIGAHIQDTCPDIEARTIASTSFMLGLAHHAMSLGYSRDEIRQYIDDEDERERYFSLARAYFAQRGVHSEDDVEGACRVGRQEIADRTTVGRLLH
ncbi:DUF5333 domain-containing protein [Nioella aestuarii]|uniref:DUF5333 domain-containing protein n=1 Tax=Nioella aestuarii TaxID=1662864 RepID=UPI003D7FB4E3